MYFVHSCSICGGFHWVLCLNFVWFIFYLLFVNFVEASFMMMNQVDLRSFDNDIDVEKKPKE